MSFLARIFRRFRGPTGFVGRDLEGNRFFEYPSVSEDPRRTKRVVKYARGVDMLDYIGGRRRLAVQWTSWLTHTRPHPPTLEELQADLERQRRVLQNAAMIEARDRAEAAQLAALEQPATAHLQQPSPDSSRPADSNSGSHRIAEPTVAEGQHIPENAQSTPKLQTQVPDQRIDPTSPWKPPPRDEPHSWQPGAPLRRGG